MRRTLIIVIAVVALVVVGVGGYLLWKNLLGVPATTTVVTPGQTNIPVTPAINPVKALTNFPVVAFKTLPDGTIRGVKSDGSIVVIQGGQAQVIGQSTIADLISASFSGNGTKVLAKFGSQDAPLFSVYDFALNTWTGIPLSLSAAAWAPTSTDIAYLEKAGNDSNIGILSTDVLQDPKNPSSGWKHSSLASFAEIDSQIAWPNVNEIFVYSRPSHFSTGYIIKYSIKENKFAVESLAGSGTTMLWSQDGGTGLKYAYAGKNSMQLVNSSFVLLRDVTFATLPQKCTFADAFLYCSIFSIDAGGSLPDDYLKKAVYLPGDFYQVDLTTGNIKSILATGQTKYDARALEASGNIITFINNYDDFLYQFSFTP